MILKRIALTSLVAIGLGLMALGFFIDSDIVFVGGLASLCTALVLSGPACEPGYNPPKGD